MNDKPLGFFEGTEMPTAGWWEALWPDPAGVLAKVGVKSGMDVIDLCSGDGWFMLQIARLAPRRCNRHRPRDVGDSPPSFGGKRRGRLRFRGGRCCAALPLWRRV
jgi:hypothetical protein